MTFIIKDPKAESFNYTLDSSSDENRCVAYNPVSEKSMDSYTYVEETLEEFMDEECEGWSAPF